MARIELRHHTRESWGSPCICVSLSACSFSPSLLLVYIFKFLHTLLHLCTSYNCYIDVPVVTRSYSCWCICKYLCLYICKYLHVLLHLCTSYKLMCVYPLPHACACALKLHYFLKTPRGIREKKNCDYSVTAELSQICRKK